MTAADVIRGDRRWSCECSDALTWLRGLPDDCADLLFTSPPYELARTYGLDSMVGGQAWVDWMVAVVTAAAPKVRGLIAVNCEGQTRDFSYSGTPFLLFADLLRAGFNMRKPAVFHRVGIPGSGGPDWLRNDWEPVICVTRSGRLPWSEPTACGHTPKWTPGGEMSHRLSDGTRRNQWGMNGSQNRRRPDGKREKMTAKGHAATRGGTNGDTQTGHGYAPPAIANPGNVLKCNVGGGQLGHPSAHRNEAPFPLELAEFMIRSFCRPDGLVLDSFSGSGTVCEASLSHGRRFAGCDIRQSQVDLTTRRARSVTPPLPATTGGPD